MDPARRLAVAPAVPDARAQRSTCTTSASCSEVCVIHHRERKLSFWRAGPRPRAGGGRRRRAGRGEPSETREHRAATTSVALRLPRGAHGPATNSWGSHDTCLPGIRYQTLRDSVPPVRTWSRGPARARRAPPRGRAAVEDCAEKVRRLLGLGSGLRSGLGLGLGLGSRLG